MQRKKRATIWQKFFSLWLLGGQFQDACIKHLSTGAVAKSTVYPVLGLSPPSFSPLFSSSPSSLPSRWKEKLPAYKTLSLVLRLGEPRLRDWVLGGVLECRTSGWDLGAWLWASTGLKALVSQLFALLSGHTVRFPLNLKLYFHLAILGFSIWTNRQRREVPY